MKVLKRDVVSFLAEKCPNLKAGTKGKGGKIKGVYNSNLGITAKGSFRGKGETWAHVLTALTGRNYLKA